jgi:site-specific DNA-cytosine methylase
MTNGNLVPERTAGMKRLVAMAGRSSKEREAAAAAEETDDPNFLRRYLLRPLVTPEMVEQLPGWLQPVGTIGRELTSPAQIALMAATAGYGPAVAGAIRGGTGALGLARSLAAGAVAPIVEAPFAGRLAAEAGIFGAATTGVMGAQKLTEDAPRPVQIGAGLVGGLAGGIGGIAALRRLAGVRTAATPVRAAAEAEPTVAPMAAPAVAPGATGEVRFASSMSSGGTVEAGLSLGSAASVYASEINPNRVKAFNEAFGTNYTARNIADKASLKALRQSGAQHYHASPVCKNFTKAKRISTADPNDLAIAQSVARDIREVKPPTVSIENVPRYRDTALFKLITKELDDAGYNWDVNIVNAADYGAVQSRIRMILRAVRKDIGELPPLPQKTQAFSETGRGADWYTTVKDLIDAEVAAGRALPLRQAFANAPDEIARIRSMFAKKEGDRLRLVPNEPIITMGGSASKGVPSARNAGNVAPTLLATEKAVPRIIRPGPKGIADATVIRVTPAMMKRLMGLPDSYVIPGDIGLAKNILGDGVHGAVTRNFIQPLVDIHKARRAVTGVPEAPTAAPAPTARVGAPDVPREWAGVREELEELRKIDAEGNFDLMGRPVARPSLVGLRESELIASARARATEAADAAYNAAKPPQGEITGWWVGQPTREITDEDAIELARRASNAVYRQFQTETGIDVRHLIHVSAKETEEIFARPTTAAPTGVTPPPRDIGATQRGMGIGETPPQGELIPEFRGEGGAVPLSDPATLAAAQARREALALGQQEFTVTPTQAVRVGEPVRDIDTPAYLLQEVDKGTRLLRIVRQGNSQAFKTNKDVRISPKTQKALNELDPGFTDFETALDERGIRVVSEKTIEGVQSYVDLRRSEIEAAVEAVNPELSARYTAQLDAVEAAREHVKMVNEPTGRTFGPHNFDRFGTKEWEDAAAARRGMPPLAGIKDIRRYAGNARKDAEQELANTIDEIKAIGAAAEPTPAVRAVTQADLEAGQVHVIETRDRVVNTVKISKVAKDERGIVRVHWDQVADPRNDPRGSTASSPPMKTFLEQRNKATQPTARAAAEAIPEPTARVVAEAVEKTTPSEVGMPGQQTFLTPEETAGIPIRPGVEGGAGAEQIPRDFPKFNTDGSTTAPPGMADIVQRLADMMNKAVLPEWRVTARAVAEERSRRGAAASGMFERAQRILRGGGDPGGLARSKMEGPLPDRQLILSERRITPEDVHVLKQRVYDVFGARRILDAETVGTALDRLADSGRLPRPYEQRLIEEITGPLNWPKPLREKALQGFWEVWNLPRAFLASFDDSAVLRQGGMLLPEGSAVVRSWKSHWKAIRSAGYEALNDEVRNNPFYDDAVENGVEFSFPSGARGMMGREEPYMGAGLAQRIPVIGKGIQISERLYSGYLNKLRMEVYEKHARELKRMKASALAFEELGDNINILSGRASLGSAQAIAPFLNGMFFSARLNWARAQAPFRILRQINNLDTEEGRHLARMLAKDVYGYYAGVLGMLGLASVAGVAKVEWDARSSDFGKAQVGTVRLDPWGGQQQFAVLMARILSGERRTTVTRQVVPAREFDTLTRFIESKFHPALGQLISIKEGKTYLGEDLTVGEYAKNWYPLFAQDILEIHQGVGPGLATVFGLAAFEGVSVYNIPGVPPLVLDQLQGAVDDYNAIPTDTAELAPGQPSRIRYRIRNPQADAALFIAGQVASLRTTVAVREVASIIQENGISPDVIRGIDERKESLKKAAQAGRRLPRNEIDRLIALLSEEVAPIPTGLGGRQMPASPTGMESLRAMAGAR